jgi:uncharacterized membrane protein
MTLRFQKRSWLREHASVPITAAYILVALLLGSQGAAVGARVFGTSNISSVSPESATAILSAIAAGTMALTAIVFSIIFVALQVGGTAYSPRVVDLFARGTFLAHALGVFTGTFMYALFAIRTVDIEGGKGVHVSVIVLALVWLLASVMCLMLLLPQVRTLAIAVVLPALYRHAVAATARIYEPLANGDVRSASAPVGLPVTREVRHDGEPCYLVGFDVRRLVRLAANADAVIVLPAAIGDAVLAGDPLAIVTGASRPIAEAQLRRALWLRPQRMPDNDPAYALRLLVDIAIRALSPAINDPTTAVSVLDRIEGILRVLAGKALEQDFVLDDSGVVRIVRAVPSWDDLVALALTEIHQYGRDSFQVQRRLSAILHDLPRLVPQARRAAIVRFAQWRAESQSDVLHAAAGWSDASSSDRQGLGHEATPRVH